MPEMSVANQQLASRWLNNITQARKPCADCGRGLMP